MKNIKGILFDKDGTLLDFNSIWVPVAIELVDELINDLSLHDAADIKEHLLCSIGVNSGKVDPLGVLAWGTAQDVASALQKVLDNESLDRKKLLNFNFTVESKLNGLSRKNANLMKPIGDLKKLFTNLKEKGIYIGLATSDTYESAKVCLQVLEIERYFDFIGADDGIAIPKPHPYLLNNFCDTCGIKPKEVAVIGDTDVDMDFANNGKAALAIAVLSGTSNKRSFSKSVNLILNSVHEIIDEKGQFIW